MADNFVPLAIKTNTNGDAVVKFVGSDGTTIADVSGGKVLVLDTNSAANLAANEATRDRLPAAFTAGGGVKTGLTDALPAGTNNIGDVDIASALPAGDNNIGNVDIASALPAGDNNIGNVDIASALPAGTNNIGDVDVASTTYAGTIAAAIPAQASLAGAKDGSGNLQALKVDGSGNLQVVTTSTATTYKTSNLLTSSALAAGASVRLGTAAMTVAGILEKVTVSSAAPLKVQIRKAAEGVDTTLGTGDDVITEHAVVFTKSGESYTYEISGGFTAAIDERFEVNIKNMDNGTASDVYATINWRE